jgi:mono/diheme cytochrome c family protein
MNNWLPGLVLGFGLWALSGCADLGDEPGVTGGSDPTSFATDVNPILQGNCTVCHGADGSSGGLDVSNWSGLMAGGQSGAVVVPGAADSSLLVERISSSDPSWRMPAGGALTAEQIGRIQDWIDEGALDN